MNGPPTPPRRSVLATLGSAVIAAGCVSAPADKPTVTPTARPTTRARTTDASSTPTDTETSTEIETETETEPETETETPTPDPEPDLPGGASLADFTAFGEAWTVESGRAGVSGNKYGDLPAVTMASAGDSRARIIRQFDQPRDFSDWDLSVAAQLHSTTKGLFQLNVTLVDADGAWRRLLGSIQTTATDQWVRLDAGVREDRGADVSAITELRIEHWAGAAESQFAVADLRRHPAPEKGYVLLTFDDGPLEDYTVAYDVLSQYDVPGTAFPHTKTITGDRGPSVEQYREMLADGWDVGGHTRDHTRMSEPSRENQREILTENKAFLAEHDLTPSVFRTPYGAYDAHTVDLMDELFDVSIVGSGSAMGTNLDISDPCTVGFNPGDDYEQAKGFVDAAGEYNQLLGLTIHMARMPSRRAFKGLIEHVHHCAKRGDLEVITPTELYADHICK